MIGWKDQHYCPVGWEGQSDLGPVDQIITAMLASNAEDEARLRMVLNRQLGR